MEAPPGAAARAQVQQDITLPATGTPPSPPIAALTQRLADTTLGTPHSSPVNWKKNRVATVGNTLIVKDDKNQKHLVSRVQESSVILFEGKSDTQGLILSEGRVEAASVTTDIRNPIPRKTQTYQTFVQFESVTIDDENADFKVYALNQKNTIFYSGCHLIDYQFGSNKSHREPGNYFPGNYFYNMSIRNWLVNRDRTAAYLEIPVYTENPPSVISKRGHGQFSIPACIFFIRISTTIRRGKNVVVIYCFPNNRFNYEQTKKDLDITKDFAQHMIPHFKLNRSLYPLFKPAIIHTLRDKQIEKEPGSAALLESLLGVREEEGEIGKLGQQVFQKAIEPTLLLPKCKQILNSHLSEALGFAAVFMVKHALCNVLKSEVFSLKARLTFINAWMQLKHDNDIEVARLYDPAEDFKELLLDEFETTFNSLPPPQSLDTENLILLAYTHLKMTVESTYPRNPEVILSCGNEVIENCENSLEALSLLVAKDPKNFTSTLKDSFLKLMLEAQTTDMRLKEWEPEEEMCTLGEFLYNQRKLCQDILQGLTPAQRASYPDNWTAKFKTLGRTPET